MKAYKKVVAILLAAITMLSLAGCGAKKSEAPAEEAPADKTTDNAAKEQQDSVTMYVHGLDTDENGLSITREYTLSSEDSEQVLEWFYEHDKEVFDMPCDCIALIEFNFGDDYLHSSGSFNSLEGRINGELVGIDLDDSEGNMLRHLVFRYAPDFENQ